MKRDKKVLIELEGSWILYHGLPDTLEKLSEDWRGLSNLPC